MNVSIRLSSLVMIAFVSFFLSGCSDDVSATITAAKNKALAIINKSIGNGEVAIELYNKKVENIREALIKVKVRRKILEQKNNPYAFNDAIVQLKEAENKLGNSLLVMGRNVEVIKAKITVLEAKKDALDALLLAKSYNNIETDVGSVASSMESAISGLQQQVMKLEAETEIEKMLEMGAGNSGT